MQSYRKIRTSENPTPTVFHNQRVITIRFCPLSAALHRFFALHIFCCTAAAVHFGDHREGGSDRCTTTSPARSSCRRTSSEFRRNLCRRLDPENASTSGSVAAVMGTVLRSGGTPPSAISERSGGYTSYVVGVAAAYATVGGSV